MKKIVAIVAVAALVLTFAFGAASTPAESLVSVIEDFEGGLGNWTDEPAIKAIPEQTITASYNTTSALMGNGAMDVTLTTLGNPWQGVEFPWDPGEAAKWTGVVFRMDATAITQEANSIHPNFQVFLSSTFDGLYKPFNALGTSIKSRIHFFDLAGTEVTLDYATNNNAGYVYLPQNFNGYVFCDYTGFLRAPNVSCTDIEIAFIDNEPLSVDGEVVTIDQYSYYKGTDFAAVIAALDTATEAPIPTEAPYMAPTVFYDFEDGALTAIQPCWIGHNNDQYVHSDVMTDALVGEVSFGIDVQQLATLNSYDGFSLRNTAIFEQAVAEDRDGIAFRMKLTLPEGFTGTYTLMPGGSNTTIGGTANFASKCVITDIDGDVLYTNHSADRFLLNFSFDGWVFLTFNAETNNGTTIINSLGNPIENIDISLSNMPVGTQLIFDQFALYTAQDYAQTIEDILAPVENPTQAPTATETPTATQATTTTEAPTATQTTAIETPTATQANDHTGDVSMIFFAIAAAGAASSALVFRKKK